MLEEEAKKDRHKWKKACARMIAKNRNGANETENGEVTSQRKETTHDFAMSSSLSSSNSSSSSSSNSSSSDSE
jgi:hypothetical protein